MHSNCLQTYLPKLWIILQVYDFFRKHIEEQYPLEKEEKDPYLHMKERHEAFMKSRCENVIGRQSIISEVTFYLFQLL